MANITGVKATELFDRSESLANRTDFAIYGRFERTNEKENAIKVTVLKKDPRINERKESKGVGFNITDDFDLEELKEKGNALIKFNAKIETFYGKDNFLRTLITFTKGEAVVAEPESTLIDIKDVAVNMMSKTDQKGLYIAVATKKKEQGADENYHYRIYTGSKSMPNLMREGSVHLVINLTKFQVDSKGTRFVGSEPYEYEKDGKIVKGTSTVYTPCLELRYTTVSTANEVKGSDLEFDVEDNVFRIPEVKE